MGVENHQLAVLADPRPPVHLVVFADAAELRPVAVVVANAVDAEAIVERHPPFRRRRAHPLVGIGKGEEMPDHPVCQMRIEPDASGGRGLPARTGQPQELLPQFREGAEENPRPEPVVGEGGGNQREVNSYARVAEAARDSQCEVMHTGDVAECAVGRQLFAEAEQLLLQNELTLNPVVNYMDTRKASEHGEVASQVPDADQKVMLGTSVSLNIYRYPTDRSLAEVPVDVPESEASVAVRITLQAAGSAFEFTALSYECAADKTGPQTMKINLPDDRVYTCRVYLDDEVVNTFEVSAQ